MGINDTDKNLCIIQNMESSAMDYTEAQDACGTGGGAKTDITSNSAKAKAFVDGNLAWMIMATNNMFQSDTDMKLVAMSLTGTVVKRQVKDVAGVETTVSGDTDSQSKSEVYPSLMLTDPDIIEALLYGKTTNRYECSDTTTGKFGCKEVEVKSWTLSAADSLVAKTNDALMRLYNAVLTRTDPTSGDIDYVAETAIPTMRIVRTAALLSNNNLGIQIINEYSEQIAIELLATYVGSIANAMSAYSFDEGYGDNGARLREGIKLAQNKLSEIRENAEINTNRSLRIAEQMEHYERIIISALPQNLNRSLTWSAGGGG